MSRISITGSADGLGQLAAKELIAQGHHVVLHARNADRAAQAAEQVRGADDVLIADLSSLEETKSLAAQVNARGRFDAIIHNAGVYQVPANRTGAEGAPLLLTVNTLAPYLLTCLIQPPKRLVYLSSGMPSRAARISIGYRPLRIQRRSHHLSRHQAARSELGP